MDRGVLYYFVLANHEEMPRCNSKYTCLQFVGKVHELAEPLVERVEGVLWSRSVTFSAQLEFVNVGHERLQC